MEYKERMKIILIACICVSIEGSRPQSETINGSYPGYSITTAIQQLNSTKCRTEMEEYRDAVDNNILWGLKILDTSGRPSSGFISGNNMWVGNRKMCNSLNQKQLIPLSKKYTKNNTVYRNPAEEFPPFQLNFFKALFRHNSTLQYHIEIFQEDVILLGLCLPASCSEHEVATMLNKVFKDRLLSKYVYSSDLQLLEVSDLKDDYTWLRSGKIIVILFILAALFGTVIMGTLYDLFVYRKTNKSLYKEEHESIELNVEEKEKEKEKDDQNQKDATVPCKIKPPVTRIGQFLLPFSLYSNIKQIFNLDKYAKDSIGVFHGMKFFGMTGIIIVHSLFYSLSAINIKTERIMLFTGIVYNGTLIVDTYFFMSGFLLSFVYLKQKHANKTLLRNQVTITFQLIVKRYLRLTPTYVVVILIAIFYFSWSENTSLFYLDEPVHQLCLKYWWRNILYINNLFELEQMCLSPSWYVANDVQFYVYGLFILTLISNYYYTAVSLSILTVLSSIGLSAYIAYSIEYTPILDEMYNQFRYLYAPPWIRIPPYIVGMATALFLQKLDYKLHLSRKSLIIGWSLAVSWICTILVGGSIIQDLPFGVTIVYSSFSRFAWSLGMAWLVIICLTNKDGIIHKFLSLPCWIPFSRISFCSYLLNELIIMAIVLSGNYPFYADTVSNIILGLGVCVITYICAVLLSAAIESPTIHFQSLLISNKRIE